jgi:hypothetical protein
MVAGALRHKAGRVRGCFRSGTLRRKNLRWETGFDNEFLCTNNTGTRLSRSKLAACQNLLLGRAKFFIRQHAGSV